MIRVFINKTLSTESLINQLLIRGLAYQLLLIVGKLGQGMRSIIIYSLLLIVGKLGQGMRTLSSSLILTSSCCVGKTVSLSPFGVRDCPITPAPCPILILPILILRIRLAITPLIVVVSIYCLISQRGSY